MADESTPPPPIKSNKPAPPNTSPNLNIITIKGNKLAPQSSPLSELHQTAEVTPEEVSEHPAAFLPRIPPPEEKSPENQPPPAAKSTESSSTTDYHSVLEQSVLNSDSTGFLIP